MFDCLSREIPNLPKLCSKSATGLVTVSPWLRNEGFTLKGNWCVGKIRHGQQTTALKPVRSSYVQQKWNKMETNASSTGPTSGKGVYFNTRSRDHKGARAWHRAKEMLLKTTKRGKCTGPCVDGLGDS